MELLKQDVKDYLIQQLQDDVGIDNDINDLHHYLINQDYFIIGYYQARKWLEKESVFEAIEKIREYEQFNFGEVTTDFSNEERKFETKFNIKARWSLGGLRAAFFFKCYGKQWNQRSKNDMEKRELEN